MANLFGDFITGLGYAASGAFGKPVQLVKGGLGQAISGAQNPQSWNPFNPSGAFASTGGQTLGTSQQAPSSPFISGTQGLGTTGNAAGPYGPQLPPSTPSGQSGAGPTANDVGGGDPDWVRKNREDIQRAEDAARNAYGAENSRLNTQFDYMAEQGRNQLGALGTQQQSEIGGVEAGLGDIQRQVGVAKTNTAESGAKQIKEAGSIARSTQGQNRNVLRALGILNSSAAGQILTKPMNTFDQQRAEIGQFIVKKSAELDDFVTQKVTEADRIKQDIMAKYSSLVNNIQTDLRFNERQRNDALGQANAAFQQHLTQLAQNTMQYQQQAQQQKQALLANLASATNYSNPTLNTALYQTLGLAQPRTQTAQIYQDPNKKKLGEF